MEDWLLINNFVIETNHKKIYKIPTYNLIDEMDFAVIVGKYVFPYTNKEAQQRWNQRVNLEKLMKEVKYERQAD
ncbi:MAG: DUF5381 family protein [Bacillota bacterium]